MNADSKTASVPLTRFTPAGILELLWVSVPIILSLVSGAVMLIVDRWFLAHYSTDAMNGAVTANMPVWALQLSGITLTSIASVFVGQYNGSGQFKKVGSAVWQMIWFSAALIPIFLLLGLFAGDYIFYGSAVIEQATLYFKWMMCFGFLAPLSAALSSFYIGRGKTSFVLFCTLAGNLVNVALNTILIFGWKIIPPLGVQGAAIATVVGLVIQCGILFYCFLQKKNQEAYATENYRFDFSLLKKSLIIGCPAALDRLINVLAWTIFILLIGRLGTVELSVISITQSMMLFFTFINQGIGRGVSSIAANCIGSQKWDLLWKLIVSAFTLNTLAFLAYGIFFMVYPEGFASLFLPETVSTASRNEILSLILVSCSWLWVAVLVDAYRWVFVGLLTAVGDTKFVMWIGSVSVWVFAIFPTYIFVAHLGVPVSYSWAFSGGYYCIVCCLYAWRFSREKWKGRLVIE